MLLTATAGKGFGDAQTYAELLTPAGLKVISAWVTCIGPDKNQVIPRNPDGSLGSPSSLVADAHAAGLTVVPYTFRAENSFLPTNLRVGADPNDFGRAIDEDVTFMRTGIDGLFCDQPDIGVESRKDFLAGLEGADVGASASSPAPPDAPVAGPAGKVRPEQRKGRWRHPSR